METIHDICETLSECGKLDCVGMASEWGFNCGKMLNCEDCYEAVFDSIAERIEAAHKKEMTMMQSDFTNCGKPYREGDAVLDGGKISKSDRRREVVERLKAYRDQPPVRDINGLIVEDTYSVGEIEGIITGKELFTTGDFIDALIGLIGTTDTEGDTSDTEGDTSDTEGDTREKLEEDVLSWCALYPTWTHANEFRDKVFGWLDRQAAITEREVREALEQTISAAAEEAEQAFNDTRRLSATIEKQRDVIARAKVAYDTVRGLFDGWEE
jgi:hypothetical protein